MKNGVDRSGDRLHLHLVDVLLFGEMGAFQLGVVRAQQADAGDVASGRAVVDATVKTLGGLDIFVYSAVANEMGDITAITEEGFDRVIAVNLKGLMFTAQAAVSHMQQGGRLILISSVFSEMVPFPGLDLYTMSKSAMIGLTPILWSTGTGADMMKRVAAPMVGGLATSFLLELLVYPALFAIWKGRGPLAPEASEPKAAP